MANTVETVTVAGELAWQVRTASAVLRFGIGPQRAAGADPARARAVTAPEGWSVAWARQVHGNRVELVGADAPNPVADCDGLATRRRRHALLVWTADCVPLLLASDTAVAAVHAGWRGVAAGIAGRAITVLEQQLGVPLPSLTAWLGPAVCGDHYPVGAEVVQALTATAVSPQAWLRGRRADLRALLTEQLVGAGVARSAVHRIEACTVADRRLASFRRDGAAAGRQWSLAVRT